ncbi:GcrA family cell cycle regulator [Rhizosaccharibacter radicis]|uniref:GcrA cell cycle regulator n=1 Tax=Rhizosaccharibacter radicis TaxID=2782605 RepID=A0ABT1VVD3_9PROT|nr:GcrA cell cycle regulator [Acetobacteraceae bacterium KSS12]
MDWTEESISLLRALWQEGLSTAEIGRRMSVTKNAVVGKAHRLSLPPRPSPIRKIIDAGSTGLSPVSVASPPRPRRGAADIASAAALDAAETVAPSPAPVPAPRPVSVAPAATVVPPVAAPVAASVAAPAANEAVASAPTETVAAPADRVPSSPVAEASVVPLRKPVPPDASEADTGTARAEAPPSRPVPERAPLRAVSAEPRRRGLTCCWPLGEPGTKEFRFCGDEPVPGKPYCAEHAALAYVKIRDRRDSVA